MTDKAVITESGMDFFVPRDELFHIEPYIRDDAKLGMKTVEFVWLAKDEMRFVEAKSSAPRKSDEPEKKDCLAKFISEISEKWLNSIQVTASKSLGVLSSKPFGINDWKNVNVKLFLVIGNVFETGWLPELQNAFCSDKVLRNSQKIWNPKNPNWIKVVNENLARKIGILPAR